MRTTPLACTLALSTLTAHAQQTADAGAPFMRSTWRMNGFHSAEGRSEAAGATTNLPFLRQRATTNSTPPKSPQELPQSIRVQPPMRPTLPACALALASCVSPAQQPALTTQPLTADAIMSRVAANQDAAQSDRAHYVYLQHGQLSPHTKYYETSTLEIPMRLRLRTLTEARYHSIYEVSLQRHGIKTRAKYGIAFWARVGNPSPRRHFFVAQGDDFNIENRYLTLTVRTERHE
jgi:hypothetical protein